MPLLVVPSLFRPVATQLPVATPDILPLCRRVAVHQARVEELEEAPMLVLPDISLSETEALQLQEDLQVTLQDESTAETRCSLSESSATQPPRVQSFLPF